jgi:hypothetical protein
MTAQHLSLQITLIIADNTFAGAGISIYSASNVAILRNTITNGPTMDARGALSASGAGSIIGNNVSEAVGRDIGVGGQTCFSLSLFAAILPTLAHNRKQNSPY